MAQQRIATLLAVRQYGGRISIPTHQVGLVDEVCFGLLEASLRAIAARPIVAEAMIAYRSIFGWSATGKPHCVEPWETDYEERDVRGKHYTEAGLFR